MRERDRTERKGLEAKAHGHKEGERDSMTACLAKAREGGVSTSTLRARRVEWKGEGDGGRAAMMTR